MDKKRILIVDDEKDIVETIQFRLELASEFRITEPVPSRDLYGRIRK